MIKRRHQEGILKEFRVVAKAGDFYQAKSMPVPEHSRLRRALKQLYLDGGWIYTYAGMIF